MTDQERIADLEATVERLERDLAQMQNLRRDAVAAQDAQAARLRSTRGELERLRGRRSVRIALGVSRTLEPIARRVARPFRRRRGKPVAPRSRGDAGGRDVLDAPGPRAFREGLLDAIGGAGRSSPTPFHLALIGPADRPATLSDLGWTVSHAAVAADGGWAVDPTAEAVLVTDDAVDIRELPSRLISIAWIGADPDRWVSRPWIDDFDIILATEPATATLVRERTSKVATVAADGPAAVSVRDALLGWATATRYGIRIGAPTRERMAHWGDTFFARGVQRALERRGHPTRVHILPDWSEPIAARDDVSIHLFGKSHAPIRRSQVNILWQVSHPDLASPEMYDRYDHVFVASDRFAAHMAGRAATPVTALHQATDPERFRPDPTGPAHDLLFVGNSRFVRRRIVDDVIATGHDIAVYGADWRPDLLDPRFLYGERVPDGETNRYYSSAAIVLNDHWNDMVAEGFISNRLYDALACGAFVISDHLPELAAEFDDAVVTYIDRAELAELIDRYLADPEARRARGARGRAAVLAHHTFEARVQVLIETVEPLLQIARAR